MDSHIGETAPMTPGRIALIVALLCLALTLGLLG
jgi:hypothetical protein